MKNAALISMCVASALMANEAVAQCNAENWQEYYPNLVGCDLQGADLVSQDLSYANLSEAKLMGANLRYACLIESNLSYADLSGADVVGVNLVDGGLIGANLTNVNLSGANLVRAELDLVNLENANLTAADLRWATLHDATLTGADLAGANVAFASFIDVDLSTTCMADVINIWMSEYDSEPVLGECSQFGEYLYEDSDNDGYDDESYEEGASSVLVGDANGDGDLDVLDMVIFIEAILVGARI